MSHLITPSILSADFGNLQDVCEMINGSDADGFHLDVMDGVFVPNISFGFPVIKAIQRHAKKPLDVHLMIVSPDRYLEQFRDAGASVLTVHLETCVHLHRTIGEIKKLGMKACVAINPHTPVSLLTDVIADLDAVCVMSVNPGFGGQLFIENTYKKVQGLRSLIRTEKSNASIKVDGGIDLANYLKLIDSGARILVAGTSVFGTKDPRQAITELKKNSKI
ncbi:MAG TPA: ribulose-phosphate 3-epimerase [Bacteroidia bacterium]|nr:ribulose-phosphate 3-epimerase [Bacteroidia bacterium]